ncbi:MAG: YdcF family protein [Alphaproteobacteria bacterium]|nr:YdcF family protein [Alphaproteobacteria bacterium]
MKFLTPSFLLLGFFVIGGMVFKSSAPRICDEIMTDDTLFVLTGDVRRIPFAMRTVAQYPDTDVYIIGAGAQTNAFDATRPVMVESESKSTYQNALAIKQIVEKSGLDRIVIVTTEDHMNRAEYLIRHELPNTEIITCPATLYGMPVSRRIERWATEYIKYIVTLVGIKEG